MGNDNVSIAKPIDDYLHFSSAVQVTAPMPCLYEAFATIDGEERRLRLRLGTYLLVSVAPSIADQTAKHLAAVLATWLVARDFHLLPYWVSNPAHSPSFRLSVTESVHFTDAFHCYFSNFSALVNYSRFSIVPLTPLAFCLSVSASAHSTHGIHQ